MSKFKAAHLYSSDEFKDVFPHYLSIKRRLKAYKSVSTENRKLTHFPTITFPIILAR